MKNYITLTFLIISFNLLNAQTIFEEYHKEIDSVKVSDELGSVKEKLTYAHHVCANAPYRWHYANANRWQSS